MSARTQTLTFAAALALTHAPARAQGSAAAPAPAAGEMRQDIDALAAALETAVGRVSRAGQGFALGRGGARGYLLAGYGAVFILTPRALPAGQDGQTLADRQALRDIAVAVRQLEQSLSRVQSPELRRRMTANLASLRQTAAVLRARGNAAPAPPEPVESTDLTALERQLELQMGEHMRSFGEAEAGLQGQQTLEQAMEAQVRLMNEQAEIFRREAAKVFNAQERALRMRLVPPAAPAPAGDSVSLADSPAPAAAAPAAPAPSAPETTPVVPSPPAPPWHFWFESFEAGDARSADAVVQDVRRAVGGVLESHAARLRMLRPEERIVVAVDFVPGSPMLVRARPARTLIVQVPKREVDALRGGEIKPADFRKRIAFVEY